MATLSPLSRGAALIVLPLFVLGALVGVGASSAGCSHDDPVEAEKDAASPPPLLPAPPAEKAPPPRIHDAGPPDARAQQALLAMADAGRFCGSKELPDCPLQLWMKQNATTMLQFGEITTLAEDFDQMAAWAPPRTGADYPFPYWVSIARDGAAAARMGDLNAAKAACRGCHTQYLAAYRATYRGLPLPPPLPPRGAPP